MANPLFASSTRVLEPIDRISEVLFGLIMVLTFTGTLSVAEAGREDVRTMLIGALGCNLAWGLIDAVLYLMGCMAERGQSLAAFRAVHRAADPAEARQVIAGALPPLVAALLQPAEIESIRERLLRTQEPPGAHRLATNDYLGALGVFLLVFLSTLPVAMPFMLMPDARPALRVSNGIAIGLLFLTGFAFGRVTGRHPVRVGCGMVVLGSLLVALTILLGG